MGTLITVLIFIICILLGVIVLIQNPKGGGLGAGFGNVNQIGGVKRTADFLEKATWSLAIGLVVLCLISSWHLASMKSDSLDAQDLETIEAPVSTPDDAAEESEDF
jgi:preprotein translocase subunit SecG